tara:strand:- start:942 stop:1370 length:429 start_codon:yes stop_codon:yes gene_type:complete
MAGPLGKYGEERLARQKAAVKGAGGLIGTGLSFIPGVGPALGAGVKAITGLVAGDEGMAATPMPKGDKGAERDKKLDAILASLSAEQKKKEGALGDQELLEDIERQRNAAAAARAKLRGDWGRRKKAREDAAMVALEPTRTP